MAKKRTKIQKMNLAYTMDARAFNLYLEDLISLRDYEAIKKIRDKALNKLKRR